MMTPLRVSSLRLVSAAVQKVTYEYCCHVVKITSIRSDECSVQIDTSRKCSWHVGQPKPL